MSNYINPPFNFTGSKFKLLPQLLPHFDYSKSNFIDLFCGGGSVYCNVLDQYKEILVNDRIEDLIKIHQLLILDTDNFISSIKRLCIAKDDLNGYLKLREDYNLNKSPEKLYTLMLSSHNNLMRFNKNFQFNQHFGKRTFNKKTQEKIDRFVSHVKFYFNKINYSNKEFYEVTIDNIEDTMCYLDPPYINTEAGYNSYWSLEHEQKLENYIEFINDNGGSFCLSGLIGRHKNNKESELINKLVKKYNSIILNGDYEKVARIKKSKESKEIIIKNY